MSFGVEVDAVFLRAALVVAERDKLPADELRARVAALVVDEPPDAPMHRLARALGLSPVDTAFAWAAVATATDPRVATQIEALAGIAVRRGIAVQTFARFAGLADEDMRTLALRLATGHPLVATGLVTAEPSGSPVTRAYLASANLISFLRDEPIADPVLRRFELADPSRLVFDASQAATLDELARLVGQPHAIVVLEGPRLSGRTSAIASAAGRPLVILDVAQLSASELTAGLAALRRELALVGGLPVIANVDAVAEGMREVARFVEELAGAVVLVSTVSNLDLGIARPLVRLRWNVAETAARRQLWERIADGPIAGDLEALSLRFRVGPGAMARAIASARLSSDTGLDADALATGLRHNIVQDLGGLAERIEVTQRWDDLVLPPDTKDQVDSLVARVRHAHRVLESWDFGSKLARGRGVAALFSGPPGTGKTMVAGLIARELGLDLYQVDLSKIVSKWIGETEKQLARVFDAAEQGHGLLLFDEADALFGQRTQDVKGATDRYANLEVNYLLQRVEAFGGITILTTNLDQGIDRALKRRLAAHVAFELPGDDERTKLWRRLITTNRAPLAGDLDMRALAEEFPKMSGANIRNAALGAAFLAAAAEAPQIAQAHLQRAARIEYRSMGFVLSERRR